MLKFKKLLKIKFEADAETPSLINVWNIWDTEHPEYIHGSRTLNDGMNHLKVYIENENFYLSLDEQKFPIFSFFKRKSLMFHYRDKNNDIYQWSCFLGIPIAQKFSVIKISNDKYKHIIQYIFQLDGLKKFLSPLIEVYAKSWMKKTWEEDLVLKKRYYKFLKYGFQNMKGLPEKIEERSNINFEKNIKIPLPKTGLIKSDDLNFMNLRNLFD